MMEHLQSTNRLVNACTYSRIHQGHHKIKGHLLAHRKLRQVSSTYFSKCLRLAWVGHALQKLTVLHIEVWLSMRSRR